MYTFLLPTGLTLQVSEICRTTQPARHSVSVSKGSEIISMQLSHEHICFLLKDHQYPLWHIPAHFQQHSDKTISQKQEYQELLQTYKFLNVL